jgi:F-type H+-transporting ATPase subunit delta
MKIDRQARQSAKRLFRACLTPEGVVDEQRVRDRVQSLVDEKPRHYLAILTRLTRLIELSMEERTFRVESATPLADQGASVFSSLERAYGPPSRTSYEENPSLLGGLRIRRGSMIWDGSLRGRLDRLEQAFS